MEVKEIEQTKTKEEIIEILNMNSIPHKVLKWYGRDRICILFDNDDGNCFDSAITVMNCNKDICKVYLNEILYIAIENRKSVLYLTDRRIETCYPIEYWKSILDKEIFAQPHYSYIVNLNYVYEVTKEFVKIKYDNQDYSVYTSSRKIRPFKQAFLNFKG